MIAAEKRFNENIAFVIFNYLLRHELSRLFFFRIFLGKTVQ